jgi:hypothetical protein
MFYPIPQTDVDGKTRLVKCESCRHRPEVMSGKSLKQQTKAINRGIVRGILFKASFVRKKKAEFGPVTAMIMIAVVVWIHLWIGPLLLNVPAC